MSDSEEGFSGWVAGPTSLEELAALQQGKGYDVMVTAQVALRRANVIKVLNLPPGFVVTFEGHAVVSVLDDEGEERFVDRG